MLTSRFLQDLERLQREMDSVFRGPWGEPWTARRFSHPFRAIGNQAPALNIRDLGEAFEVQLQVPGANQDTLSVKADRDTLTVTGERVAHQPTENEEVHRSERVAGRFTRTFSLPVPVAVDQITASYRDGVLVVNAPKAEEARSREISVSVN